jgi:hypothetical protein
MSTCRRRVVIPLPPYGPRAMYVDRHTALCANYVLVSSVRHAAIFLCSEVAAKPYNGLAARSAAKEQSLTSQGTLPFTRP